LHSKKSGRDELQNKRNPSDSRKNWEIRRAPGKKLHPSMGRAQRKKSYCSIEARRKLTGSILEIRRATNAEEHKSKVTERPSQRKKRLRERSKNKGGGRKKKRRMNCRAREE